MRNVRCYLGAAEKAMQHLQQRGKEENLSGTGFEQEESCNCSGRTVKLYGCHVPQTACGGVYGASANRPAHRA